MLGELENQMQQKEMVFKVKRAWRRNILNDNSFSANNTTSSINNNYNNTINLHNTLY